MPCYQSTNLPSGVTTTGRTSYTTEADCLNACQEGACCEGTTCTVKPQCQCQCTTGRCCGPDLVEVRTGEFYPAYRVETKAACLARGGSWKCGSFGPQSIEGVLPSAVGKPVCPVNAGTPEPVFKGVGTTCSPNPCACYCSDGTTLSATSLSATITGTTQNLGTGVYYRGWPSQTIKTKTYTLYKESCSRWTATIPTPPAAMEGSTLSATSQLVFTTDSPTGIGYVPRFEIIVLHNTSGANLATYSIWQRFGNDADSRFCRGESITSDLSEDISNDDVVSIQAISANPLP